MLQPFDVVRVTRLLTQERPCDGSEGVARPPRVGDVGAIVHAYEGGPHPLLAVECVDGDGRTVWVADFRPEELERVGGG